MTGDGDSGSQKVLLFYHCEETGTFTLPSSGAGRDGEKKMKCDDPSTPQQTPVSWWWHALLRWEICKSNTSRHPPQAPQAPSGRKTASLRRNENSLTKHSSLELMSKSHQTFDSVGFGLRRQKPFNHHWLPLCSSSSVSSLWHTAACVAPWHFHTPSNWWQVVVGCLCVRGKLCK